MNSNILITGGAGFIGSNLTTKLVSLGHQVTVFDNLSSGTTRRNLAPEIRAKIKFVRASVTNSRKLATVMKNIDYVIHLAAIPSVSYSITHPELVHRVNTVGTLNVLQTASDANVKKVIYTSSAAVYGRIQNLPLKEDGGVEPNSPYAVSKLVAEYYCKLYSQIYNLPTVSLRLFNVYGKNQNPESEYAGVISKFISRLKSNQKLVIYGDGNQTRDFIHVDDVVNAILLAMNSSTVGDGGEIINIATGVETSINELAKLIIELVIAPDSIAITNNNNIDSRIIYQELPAERRNEVRHSVATITKAKELLNWEPRIQLKQGLKMMMTMMNNVDVCC